MNVHILSVSAKGQITLPVNMRKKLNIQTGDKLAVHVADDTLLLKVLKLPSVEEFEKTLNATRAEAEEKGYMAGELIEIIKSVRNKFPNK